MPSAVSYQPTPTAIQYEIDADGTLHIYIPPQPTGFRGRNRIIWLGYLLGSLTLVAVSVIAYRDLRTVGLAAGAASVLAIFGVCYGLVADLKFKRRMWIDATSQQLNVRSQRGNSISERSFSRDRLRAVDVIRLRDADSPPAWLLRVHGRYEWEILLDHLSRRDSEEVAERLRGMLQLPKAPH